MRVICAGMYRSGSTWQFNAVRIILEKAFGKDNVYSSWVETYEPTDKRPYHVVKTHKYYQRISDLADIVVVSNRSEKGIIESMKRRAEYLKENPDPRFNNSANLARLKKIGPSFRKWRGQAKYIQRFNEMVSDPEKVITETCETLGVAVSVKEVLKELNEMKPPEEGFDKTTLLHAGHITKKHD